MNALADVSYGFGIGLVLGLTGGGGSIVTLPVLVYLVGEAVHPAIATSLAIVGTIAAQGALVRRNVVRWKTGAILGGCGILGAVPGSLLSGRVAGNVLLMLFSATMLVAATAMLRKRTDREESGRTVPIPVGTVVAAGFGLGFCTGFLGIGGGFLIVPVLVFVLNLPMRAAIATSLFVIALNSAWSLAAHAVDARVDWTIALLFVAGGVCGNVAGLAIGRRLAQRQLKAAFAVLVIGIGIFTGASASGLLPIRPLHH